MRNLIHWRQVLRADVCDRRESEWAIRKERYVRMDGQSKHLNQCDRKLDQPLKLKPKLTFQPYESSILGLNLFT